MSTDRHKAVCYEAWVRVDGGPHHCVTLQYDEAYLDGVRVQEPNDIVDRVRARPGTPEQFRTRGLPCPEPV